jgi:hypothetical protein
MKVETTPSVELLNMMEDIEKEIEILKLRHEIIRLELIRRIPGIENYDSFKSLLEGETNGKIK